MCAVQYVQLMMSFITPSLSQSCIDWNRDVLKRELGLDDEDIIDLPILFKLVREDKMATEYRAVAYYPDMVRSDILLSCGFQFKKHYSDSPDYLKWGCVR